MLPKPIKMSWMGTFRRLSDGVHAVKTKLFSGVDEKECREGARLFIKAVEEKGYAYVQGGFEGDYKDVKKT